MSPIVLPADPSRALELDTLLALLSQDVPGPAGATVVELVDASGHTNTRRNREILRADLRKLIKEGQIEATLGWRTDIAGRRSCVPIYRLVKETS